MLLPDVINPEFCIFYNASFILKSKLLSSGISLPDLFAFVQEEHKMSFSTFVLCLDWLFLIDAVVIDETGVVRKCSSKN